MDAVLIAEFSLGMDGYGVIVHCAHYRGVPRRLGLGLVWLAFAVGASLQPLRLTLHPCLAVFFIGCYICNMDRRCERASIVYPCCNL